MQRKLWVSQKHDKTFRKYSSVLFLFIQFGGTSISFCNPKTFLITPDLAFFVSPFPGGHGVPQSLRQEDKL